MTATCSGSRRLNVRTTSGLSSSKLFFSLHTTTPFNTVGLPMLLLSIIIPYLSESSRYSPLTVQSKFFHGPEMVNLLPRRSSAGMNDLHSLQEARIKSVPAVPVSLTASPTTRALDCLAVSNAGLGGSSAVSCDTEPSCEKLKSAQVKIFPSRIPPLPVVL